MDLESALRFLPQAVVSGLEAGVLYALPALAFILIYRSSDVMNFAQGEMAMFSTFVALAILNRGLPLPVAFLGAIVFGALLGIVTERFFLRPIEAASHFSKVILTLGIAIVLLAAAGFVFGYDTHPFPSAVRGQPIRFSGVVVTPNTLLTLGVAITVMVAIYCFFKYTMAGIAMRAIAENATAAQLMGVNLGTILSLTWAVSCVIGAVAGLLIAPKNFVNVAFMFDYLIKAFAAAVLGGFTSLPGVVVGGLLVGVLENLVGLYIAVEWKTAFAFSLIVVVLAVRPTGLMGAPLVKKV
ncbi:MAG TPA: branched-chain amino acid ABC transporter permease [Chloroflexota bacterium]|nr:branched-chain amino acid ABC transporter permease [Chloroflexota bacterium]